MGKKTLLAVVISLLIVLLYPLILVKFFPQAIQKSTTQIAKPSQDAQYIIKKDIPPAPTHVALTAEEKLSYSTNNFDILFSNIGGCIKEIRLKKLPSLSKPVSLLEAMFPQEAALNIVDFKPQLPVGQERYSVERLPDRVIYKTILENKLELKKVFILSEDKYSIDLEVHIKNLTGGPLDIGYTITAGSLVAANPEEARFLETDSKLDLKIQKDTTRGLRSGFVMREGNTDWAGIKNKYFAIALKPQESAAGSFTRLVGTNGLCTSLIIKTEPIPADSTIIQKFMLYAGPLDHDRLAKLGLSDMAGFGMLYNIGRVLLSILKFFFILVRNWGAAIILLTILVNVVLFPLTRKSYKSIQKMQALQPQIAKLQKDLKDNPQRLNKEIMELYKKYKVNPFGGCLPMIMQMPIFIALYQTLSRSLELKDARFLWIKDLSAPDRAFSIKTSLPIIGDSINILPILMAVAMFVQQKISSPKSVDKATQEQQNIMKIMPFIFCLFFYSLPAGLVLYWLIQTVLMSTYQYRLMHVHPAEQA